MERHEVASQACETAGRFNSDDDLTERPTACLAPGRANSAAPCLEGRSVGYPAIPATQDDDSPVVEGFKLPMTALVSADQRLNAAISLPCLDGRNRLGVCHGSVTGLDPLGELLNGAGASIS